MSNKLAYYDPQKDIIVNAAPYTYSWFHEKRHQTQYKSSRLPDIADTIGMYVYTICGFISLIGLPLGAFTLVFLMNGLFVTPYVLFCMFLEIDAYIFGTINYFKYKKENKYE